MKVPEKYRKPLVISAEEVTKRSIPKFNPFACGHGPHGDTKYNRRKMKRDLRRDLEE